MKRPAPSTQSTVFLAGVLLTLSACATDTDPGAGTSAPTATATVTVSEKGTPTTGEDGAFGQKIAQLTQVDRPPLRFEASSHIFPQQPGFQFTSPDGTYCEVYGQPEGAVAEATALCTYSGDGDVNAVSVSEGQPATTPHVNRIFAPAEETRPLEPGTQLTAGAVACGVPGDEVAVTCAPGPHGFTVGAGGVETGQLSVPPRQGSAVRVAASQPSSSPVASHTA